MSKKAVEHHHKAAEHHEHAARHHKDAARHHEAGKHETAAQAVTPISNSPEKPTSGPE